MSRGEEFNREHRRIRLVRGSAASLGVMVLALAAIARFDPERLARFMPGAHQPFESAGLAARVESAAPAPPAIAGGSRASGPAMVPVAPQVQDTSHTSAPGTTTDSNPPPRRRRTVTDVVLLPCSTANPRPDGSFVIPPHNPRHRTIVGLPSKPGEPRRGFVVPPHDPTQENRVPIRVISMDSILDQSLQVPPHDPTTTNIVRPYQVPCLADSTAQ
ncbi:MAG: hypothetical protein ACJ8DC_17285 [Gemmatimonadales bacterium]